MDAAGNLFIADWDNHRVRRVSAGGMISTIAGMGVAGNSGDGGLATSAQLNTPNSVALDATGNLYIADTGNGLVRVVSPEGRIHSIAAAGLVSPVYALPDSAGNIYIADDSTGRL
jgi:sugar lactone lactonase YvrE